jgi:hypothetical protein
MSGNIDKEVPMQVCVEQHVGPVPLDNWHSYNLMATSHPSPKTILCVNNQPTHSLPLTHPQFPLATDRNGLSLALAACTANSNYTLPKPSNAKYNL